jgi:hypothetical protein
VRLADADAGSLDRVGGQRRAREPAQEPDQLRQCECSLDTRMGFDHGVDDVLPLEAEHEVERVQLDACEVARSVAREIEGELLGDCDRLR